MPADKSRRCARRCATPLPTRALLLKPGVYRESLVIKKELADSRRGYGGRSGYRIVGIWVIVLDGACLSLAGLTLKGIGGKDKKTLAAVEVKSGHLVMEDCDLTSDASTVMEVKGAQSEAILRRCHLHDGKAGGILFQEGAIGYLEECHLYQNKLSQVVIGKGCSPILLSCKISHALDGGNLCERRRRGLYRKLRHLGQCRRRGAVPARRKSPVSTLPDFGERTLRRAGRGAGRGAFRALPDFRQRTDGRDHQPAEQAPIFRLPDFRQPWAGRGDESGRPQGELLDCEIFSNEDANVLVKEKSATRSFIAA